jgi:hypothetical protein
MYFSFNVAPLLLSGLKFAESNWGLIETSALGSDSLSAESVFGDTNSFFQQRNLENDHSNHISGLRNRGLSNKGNFESEKFQNIVVNGCLKLYGAVS